MTITNEQVVAFLKKASASFGALASQLESGVAAGVATTEPAVIPPPANAKVWAYDDRGFLRDGWTMVGSLRVDPVIDGTCPTAIAVRSGRYVSVPRPDLGEMFTAYVGRVSRQLGRTGDLGLGVLFLGPAAWFDRFGGFKQDGSNWHLAADFFYNPEVYYTDAEKAARQQWVQADAAALQAAQASAGGVQPSTQQPVVVPIEGGNAG